MDRPNIVDQEHMEIVGYGQKIRGAERLFAQVRVIEARHVARRLRHRHLAPQHRK